MLLMQSKNNIFWSQIADASQPKAVRMGGSPVIENENKMETVDESSYSTLDILLLGTLLLAAIWWLMRRNKQEDYTPAVKSYSIQ